MALAESQFANKAGVIVNRLAELIRNGEIKHRISGGELLGLLRILGRNIKVDISIRIEDHGKLLSFSDKLNEDYE